jgi:HK97 family phage major capsid protein
MTTPFNTNASEKAFHVDVQGVEPQDVIGEALVLTTSTKAGDVEGDEPAVRVPRLTLDGSPDFVAEGDTINDSQPDDSETVIHTGKVAVLTSVSREQYGQATTASLLNAAVRRALVRKANAAYLAQAAPSGPAVTPPAGLLEQDYFDGGTLDESLDALVDAVAHIEQDGGVASHVVCNPLAWATISKLKAFVDSNQSLVGAGTTSATRQLLSLPVYVDRDVPDNQLVVLDKNAVLSVWGQLLIATSSDFLFDRDSIAIRATFRFGSKIAHEDRVVVLGVGGS